jgi:hypothetical protein
MFLFYFHAGKLNFPHVLERNGGDDETRTRDFYRGSLGIRVLSATYVLNGAASR